MASSISPFLHFLFNISLSSGKIPAAWKVSNVTPIFKSGYPALVKNYRPISLLSLVSKVLERLVHNVLIQHILSNGLLSDWQFWFHPGSSTIEAILACSHDWHDSMEQGGSSLCVFFDLSKAFDSLPHLLVLPSLERVGVCGSLLGSRIICKVDHSKCRPTVQQKRQQVLC